MGIWRFTLVTVITLCAIIVAQSSKQRVGSQATDNAQQSSLKGKIVWSGQSDKFGVQWTTTDLYVRSNSDTINLWGPLAESGFKGFAASLRDDPAFRTTGKIMSCEYNRSFELLSVVGHLVSFSDRSGIFCGSGAPGLDNRFTTVNLAVRGDVRYSNDASSTGMDIDLDNKGRIATLADYFEKHDVLQALLSDSVVSKALSELEPVPKPKSLTELPQLFAKSGYQLGSTGYELRPDFLTRFAFHHLEGDKVAVRISLPPHFGYNHATHLQLGLLLPIPPSLQRQFNLAAKRQEGFMMKDSREIAHGQVTKYSFRTGS